MKYPTIILFCWLFVGACGVQTNFSRPNDDLTKTWTKEEIRHREAIANEIVSNYIASVVAVSLLNNTNAVEIALKMEALTERLDIISKELDPLGQLSADLRVITLKKLADVDESYDQTIKNEKSGNLKPEAFKVIQPAISKYYSVWIPLMIKSRLCYETNNEASRLDTNDLNSTRPP